MNILRNFLVLTVALFLLGTAALVGYNLAFSSLIFPRTFIAGVDVSGIDKEGASALVEEYFSRKKSRIILRNGEEEIDRLESFQVSYDFIWAVDQAMGVGRTGNILTQISDQIRGLIETRAVRLPISYDADELEGILVQIEDETNIEPVWPELSVTNEGVVLYSGKDGLKMNKEQLKEEIVRRFGLPGTHVIEVPTQVIVAQEDENASQRAWVGAQKWMGKQMVLKGNGKTITLTDKEVIRLFGLTGANVNEDRYQELLGRLTVLESEPKDAVFSFENNKVKEFSPEVVGAVIDIPKFREDLGRALYESSKSEVEVGMILTFPKITAGEINDLGIKELIGIGKSKFAHSIPGRVFNVNLASERINGVLVPPGDEFSFNGAVGEISRSTGYQSAYIISGGKTILGDGGGVCQVSTTTFRAALNAGLPITERKAHAYRVGYYEQDSKPGIDATVYNPTADLKFKNDTGHYILIQTKVDTKNMTMEVAIYGTSDGRKATLTEPKISSQSPPKETLYVDDPTLPSGTKKQIDWSAWGAKVSFDYKVERNGETIFEKTFYSNYQSWQAVYLVGTGGNI